MNNIDKKYVILGSLCALVLMLAVGYAAFNAVLNIKGTTNINSNWDVKITGIEKIESKGATDNEGSPSYDNINGLSATFNTNFTTPGDYATYKIEITNNGSLDAILSNIKVPENTNNDIIFYLNKNQNNEDITDALKLNSTLFRKGETGNIGYVYVTVLYRDYENQQTAPTKTSNMTIAFDFEQASGNGGTTGGIASDYTGTLYSVTLVPYTNLPGGVVQYDRMILVGDSIETIKAYAKEDYNSLGNSFLKHIVNNGTIESNEICFIKDGLHCIKPNEYETSKASLLSIFGESACYLFDNSVHCYNDSHSLIVDVYNSGSIRADGDSATWCSVESDGNAACIIRN